MDVQGMLQLAALADTSKQREFLGPLGPDKAFKVQAEYIDDTRHRFITLRGSRRAGKTSAHARKVLRNALRPPFTHQYFVGPTLKRAKEILWGELKLLNSVYRLGGVTNETTGSLRFPSLPRVPEIRLGGVNNKEDVDKIRGDVQPPKLIIVEEAQSWRPSILRTFINDAAEPALADYGGQLVVGGTPGAVCAGTWYDIDAGREADQWHHKFWTLQDNTFLQDKRGMSSEAILEEVLQRRKIGRDDPTFAREWLGLWVDDPDALVLHYDEDRNGYEPGTCPELDMRALAGDIGVVDADALVGIGWQELSDVLWIYRQQTRRGQGTTALGNMVKAAYDEDNPFALVFDLGALGKKTGIDLQEHWGLPVEAAEKKDKLGGFALADDALRTGRLRLEKGSPMAEEAALIQWDADARAKGELKISDHYHSDLWPAAVYGLRRCKAHLEDEPKPKLDPEEERREERRQRRSAIERQREKLLGASKRLW